MYKTGRQVSSMIPMKSRVSSTPQPCSVTCRRQGRSRQPSFIQTCERSEIGPIIVTMWGPFNKDGPHESNVWKETQSVLPHRASDVDIVLSASLREARAYFREGHVADDAVSRIVNSPFSHES